MDSLVVSLPTELRERLQAMAERTERPVEQCLELAVFEYVEHWERHLRDVQELQSEGDDRPLLRAVNE
jgi:predicted transcriptional regulator